MKRYFKNNTGFTDGTIYVQYNMETGECLCIKKDAIDMALLLRNNISFIENVALGGGTWSEISATQANAMLLNAQDN